MRKNRKLRVKMRANKLSIPDFILLAALSLNGTQKECTFARLLKECFSLSPQTFCFPQISHWPDARKIDRPLRALRKKGFIKGFPETSFSLTLKGKRIAKELAKVLRQKKLFKD